MPTVEDDTPVEIVHRQDTASLNGPEAIAALAGMISRLAQEVNLDRCYAMGFKHYNPALGRTFLSVLAR